MRLRYISTAILLAAGGSGCATNPLKDASFWHMDQCARSTSPTVRLNRGQDSVAFVARSYCQAVVSASGNIERVANYRVDRILLASIEDINAFATNDKDNRPVLVVTLGMLKALRQDEDAWAGLLFAINRSSPPQQAQVQPPVVYPAQPAPPAKKE